MKVLPPEIKYSLIIAVGVLTGIIWTVISRPQLTSASPVTSAVVEQEYQTILVADAAARRQEQFSSKYEPLLSLDPTSDVFNDVYLFKIESGALIKKMAAVELGWRVSFLGDNNGWYRYQVTEIKQTDIDSARQLVSYYDDVIMLYSQDNWYSDEVALLILKAER